MWIFPSLPEEPSPAEVFRRYPHTLPPLLDYPDRLLRDLSPLTVAQRELIAAYVSGLNDSTFIGQWTQDRVPTKARAGTAGI